MRNQRRVLRLAIVVFALVLLAGRAYLGRPPLDSGPSAPGTGGTARPDAPGGALRVHFIDVGQGDAILVQLPNGRAMLVDAGEAANAPTVVRYLRAHGVKTIDYLVATHPHADHIGGMAAILDSFEVRDVYMPRSSHTTNVYEDLLTAIKAKGLLVTEARAGREVPAGPGVEIVFAAPRGGDYRDANDWSAVLRISCGHTSFLLAGDAGSKSEGEMLVSGRVSLRADVLKVAHHGSGTSTTPEFLAAVAPRYAVISVGSDNPFGHPSPRTVERLLAVGAEVFRTDLHGTIVIESDGSNLGVKKEREG
ncbi:MAG: MBL fold metallo-hydrolase [Firmicutes bacterium]|nr:MBL fold metallo-hydrolase [Bacillota bacterium]